MAKYLLNEAAVAKARKLIDARQYVLDSDWGAAQPRADAQNAHLKSHSWEKYADVDSPRLVSPADYRAPAGIAATGIWTVPRQGPLLMSVCQVPRNVPSGAGV
jgi:hypothetical protein